MSDLINRQDAIDALLDNKELLNRVLDDMDVVGTDREKYSWGLGLIESSINDIEELPSAETERNGNAERKIGFLEKFIEENKEFLYEFMCYVLDDKGFTEHGTSIGSAWITEKGKSLLRMIEEVCEEE